MDNIRKILLIRHGESIYNHDGNRLSGMTDVNLTERGISECRKLGRILNNLQINQVYSSPLKRAMTSAKLIFPNNEIIISERLREINYGDYEGINAQLEKSDPIIMKWHSSPGDLTFPGGDNILEFSRRFFQYINEIVNQSTDDTIAFLTHRTAIRLFVATVIRLDLDNFRLIPCSNCSITDFRFEENSGFQLSSLNLIFDMFRK